MSRNKKNFARRVAGITCLAVGVLGVSGVVKADQMVLADLASDYNEVGKQLGVSKAEMPASAVGNWEFLESTDFNINFHDKQKQLTFAARNGTTDATGYLNNDGAWWGVSEGPLWGEAGVDSDGLYVLGGDRLLIRWRVDKPQANVDVDFTIRKLAAGGNGFGLYVFVDGNVDSAESFTAVAGDDTAAHSVSLGNLNITNEVVFLFDPMGNAYDGASLKAVISTVPEPASIGLMGLGLIIVTARRRK